MLPKRKWVYIEARPTPDSYEMVVREPKQSLYEGKPILVTPRSPAEALGSTMIQEFFAVAEYIAFNDPAVSSYLLGEEVSPEGRDATVN